MENLKRAERRWKSKCKFEKRLKIWVNQGSYFKYSFIGLRGYDGSSPTVRLGGHLVEDFKNEIRAGKCWSFLKWTSTPCSCYCCSPSKYERIPKFVINKHIWDDIQDSE